MKRAPAPEVGLLLHLIDEAYEKKAWHGPNLKGSIRGLDVAEATWRPAAARHNIWEHVVHAAYWKYAVCRRLTGEKRGSFPLTGSNWFPRPAGDRSWRDDVCLLDEMHRNLRAAVATLTPHDLARVTPGAKVSHRAVLTGIAAHDVYHAGQIQLLKRLAREFI
jgi:hypothetical protein